ncbi:MAG: MarR family transcriptional regulator [Chloroflexota bacterium]|nr:MAG: MarR family transcriptional regulator [Chloroflexota bacterium]
MAVNIEQENTVLRLWLLLRRVGDTLVRCQDLVFGKYGLTTEQWGLLTALKARGPLRPSDLADILERTPNSMSMLIDRMVKAGLVRRARDRKDRRVVTVFMTEKGKTAVEPAIPAGWEFIHEVLLPLSDDEQRDLADMLERVKWELVGYLEPEMDTAEIVENSLSNDPDLYRRMVKTLLPQGYEAKRTAAKKTEKGVVGRL